MVYYIDAFPERFHHPKEESYLFRLLRLRHPEAAPVLDRLHAEHREGELRIRELEIALRRYEHGGDAHFEAFAAAVEDYAAFHWRHMRAEEDEVLPLARAHLSPGDWEEIDDAFAGNTDPLLGAAAGDEYEALFRRIAHLVGAGREGGEGERGAEAELEEVELHGESLPRAESAAAAVVGLVVALGRLLDGSVEEGLDDAENDSPDWCPKMRPCINDGGELRVSPRRCAWRGWGR